MFEVGEHVVCGNNGVCLVKDITTLSMSGIDKKRMYYILKPVYAGTSTVYVPVDAVQSSLRRVLTRKEADALLAAIPELAGLDIQDEKTAETQYRGCMQSGECSEWARLLKTLHFRKKVRQEKGQKVTALDSRYYKLAEESLSGELAVSLGVSREEVCRGITKSLTQVDA